MVTGSYIKELKINMDRAKLYTLAFKMTKDRKSTKVIGLTISRKDMVVICSQMGQSIQDNGRLEKWKEKARW